VIGHREHGAPGRVLLVPQQKDYPMADIKGRRIAVLATDGVEEVELTEPMKALREAGAEVTLVSLRPGQIQAMQQDVNPAGKYQVDMPVQAAQPRAFDGLVLPGGTTNPDKLRMDDKAVAFVRGFVDNDKPIAAICHGPWTLVDAGGVKGHRMTSWPSLKTDLRNAGAEWVDETVVRHGRLVTSRNPHDLPAFCRAIVDLFAEAA
jgi:protease I